jgi:hypothetical protein
MVIAHAGLARLSTPRMVWDALPFSDRPFRVKTWTYAADTVPLDPVAFAAWLDERWGEVDAWVEENAAPYLPGHEPTDEGVAA